MKFILILNQTRFIVKSLRFTIIMQAHYFNIILNEIIVKFNKFYSNYEELHLDSDVLLGKNLALVAKLYVLSFLLTI